MEGTDIALIAIPEVTPSCVGLLKVFDLWKVTLGSLWWKKENRATSCAIVGFPFVTKMFDQSQTIKVNLKNDIVCPTSKGISSIFHCNAYNKINIALQKICGIQLFDLDFQETMNMLSFSSKPPKHLVGPPLHFDLLPN